MANISIHGSHNGSVVIEENGEIVVIIEIERFYNLKNYGLSQYKPVRRPFITIEKILEWVEGEYGIKEYDKCFYSSSDFFGEKKDRTYKLLKPELQINAKEFIPCEHHLSHAYGVFYQSDYEDALIFSFDGGGDDGKFNVYKGNRENGIERLEQVYNPKINRPGLFYDLGFPYMLFGHYCSDIRLEHLPDGNLVYPGKIMGLAPYGNVREEWLTHFMDFFRSDPDGRDNGYVKLIEILGEKIGIKFDVNQRLEGQDEYDVVATAQKAFEECFLEIAKPYMDRFPNLPVCIAGGCGLNITLNNRIREEFKKEVFVGPNPSDCGIATGHILRYLKPKNSIDVTYKGIPILDKPLLGEYSNGIQFVKKIMKEDEEYHYYEQTELETVIDDLVGGKIIGVVQGNSEHGPRALGNRSIICNPSLKDMKDILNAKVKNREWYRPFAPIVRLEDVSKYFEFEGESRWMTFSPKVKNDWRDKLPAITHVDGSSRVQTVTEEQNPFMYKLLTEMDKKTGVGMLVNTSFNVNGKPILSTYRDAFEIFNKTDMDGLIIENIYIKK